MQWLLDLASNHAPWVYAAILLTAIAEGPYISLILGVILHLGYLSFFPVYGILMLGDLIGDTVWYAIGRIYGHRFIRRFGKYFSLHEEQVNKVMKIFEKYKVRVLFISKISNGFGFALLTLMTAGMIKIPFGKYLAINLVGQFVWTGLLLSIGAFLGHAYETVNGILAKMSVIALAVLIGFAMYGYKKYLGERAKKL